MTDETIVTQQTEEVVTSADQTSGTNDTQKAEKKDDGMIPRHRLNESETKRREAEEKMNQLSKDYEVATSKLTALEQALRGAGSQGERDAEIEAFEKKFNLQGTGFAEELMALTSKKLSKTQQQDPAVIEAVMEVKFNKELEKLATEIPDIDKLTREERAELRTRAFSKELVRTPLKTIYRDMMFDKRTSDETTFETSRSGGRAPKEDENPDFGKMSPEEMREWSSKNLKHRRHR